VRFKGTLGLLLVFAALGGYVYFTEFRGAEEKQKAEDAKKKLFSGETKDIAEITLDYEGRTVTAKRKDEKRWEITTPAGLDADSEAWEQMASGFYQIEKGDTISAQKTDLAPYGLDKPLVSVKVKLKSGSAAGVLLGHENPSKAFIYAKKVDADEVFLSAASGSGSFKKTLTDLRDKKVLDFEAGNIDTIRVTPSGKPELEIQKSGTDWQIKKPLETRADGGEVSAFLSSIQFSRASAFADEAVDAKASGLDSPAVKITLHDQKANAERILLFGKSPEKDKYYAKDQSRPAIFILAMEIIEKAQKPLFDWRDRSVARLGETGASGIDELEIVRGADKLTLKKAGANWQTADGKKTSEAKVADMLGALESEKATQILDAPAGLSAYGLDKPRLQVSVRRGGKEVETVKFGRDNTTPAGVFVKASGPAIMTAGKPLYDRFNVQLSDLVEAPAAPPPPAK